ncbi:unnamed protein product [Pedinophyceae sp. YPF-701]|nr:unnamed protein product [Pedinophyceae sp. YPF-701]
MYDQRLFNQDAGMASGFAADDAYNLYDKALYADRSKTYKAPAAGGPDDDLGDDAPGRRFKPTKGFAGADSPTAGTKRGAGGVEFEKAPGEADPFGLDDFLSNAKRPRTDG